MAKQYDVEGKSKPVKPSNVFRAPWRKIGDGRWEALVETGDEEDDPVVIFGVPREPKGRKWGYDVEVLGNEEGVYVEMLLATSGYSYKTAHLAAEAAVKAFDGFRQKMSDVYGVALAGLERAERRK